MADFAPTHPGAILLTEFLHPLGISQYRIAKAIDVPPRRINEIVHMWARLLTGRCGQK
jgi:addiction module HigA family antidote